MRWLLGIVLLGLVAAAAQEVRRPDPQADPRLKQTVSLRYAATPIRELLADLSRRTGVSLSAAPRIREYRAFARLQNRPLHEVMRLLAKAFGFEWRVETDPNKADAPLRYVLYQPASDYLAEQQYQQLMRVDAITVLREAVRSIPPDLLQRDFLEFGKALGIRGKDNLLIYPPSPDAPYVALLEDAPKAEPTRVLVHYARMNLLQQATYQPSYWFALQMLARFSEDDWRTLQQTLALCIPRSAVSNELLQRWEQAERQMQESMPITDTTIPEQSDPIEDPETAELLRLVEAEPVTAFNWTSMQFVYNPVSQTLDGTLHLVKESKEFRMTRSRGVCRYETHSWLVDMLEYLSFDSQQLLEALDEPSPYDLWNLRTPFATIKDPMWLRDKQTYWAEYLSYRLIEACEGANIETVGEFYPLHTARRAFSAGEPVRSWQQLMNLMTNGYWCEFDGKVVVWSAAARPLARLYDVPRSQLAVSLRPEALMLDSLAALTARLPFEAFEVLALSRACWLSETYSSPKPMQPDSDAWLQTLNELEQPVVYAALRFYHSLTAPQRDALRRNGLRAGDLSTPQVSALGMIVAQLISDCEQGKLLSQALPQVRISLEEQSSEPAEQDASPKIPGALPVVARRAFELRLDIDGRTTVYPFEVPVPARRE